MKNTLKITVSVIGMMSLSLGIVGILSSLLFLVSCGGGEEEEGPAASVSANPLVDEEGPAASVSANPLVDNEEKVPPIAVSMVASTASPLTETTLKESVVTLTLSGGTYEQWLRKGHANAFKVSGIAGVTLKSTFDDFNPFFDVKRVNNAAVTVKLDFAGDIDTDATLTFTVEADAIAEYNGPALTSQVPVTAVIEVPKPPEPPPLPEPPAQQQPQPPPLPEPPVNDLRACAAGMTLKPRESCSYVAGKANVVFSVLQDGSACREGGPVEKVEEIFGLKVNVNIENQNICRNNDIERDDAFKSNFSASKNPDGSWTIDSLP